MRGIRKAFPGVVALDGVDFFAGAGEIHAILGQNGAGKTTLMNVLSGLYQPDEGVTLLHGEPVRFRAPRDALRAGIGMVHQHFKLVPSMTAVENVLLGLPQTDMTRRPWRARLRNWSASAFRHRSSVARLASQFNFPVDLDAPIRRLSIGEQQRVEIIKMLYRGVKVLILDEPTSALTPAETDRLFTMLRRMASAERTILLISHKLEEVTAVADRITVLRAGRRVATLRAAEATARDLAALIMGEAIGPRGQDSSGSGPTQDADVALSCRDLWVGRDDGRWAVRGCTLDVRAGEIVGIAGVAGNGQRELLETIAGLRSAASGRILLGGRDVTGASIRARIEQGVSYLPADRLGVAAAPGLSVADNLLLKGFRSPACGSPFWLDRSAVERHARRLIEAFGVTGAEPGTSMRSLSGGNVQRVLLARELDRPGKAFIAESPARGLDIAASAHVHALLESHRRRGAAILLASEDVDELFLVCTRVGVMDRGELRGVWPRDQVSRLRLGALMSGVFAP